MAYRLLALALLLGPLAGLARPVGPGFDRLDGSYPWRRLADGIPAFLYGGVTTIGSIAIILNSRSNSDTDRSIAVGSAFLGGALWLDSFSLVFGRSSGERALAYYRQFPAGGDGFFPNREAYGEAELAHLAEDGRSERRWRGVLALASTAPYFYYFFSNRDRYRNYQYLGAGLAALALYRLLIPSPEESAHSALVGARGGPSWSVATLPDGGWLWVSWRF